MEFAALNSRVECDGVVLSDHCRSIAFNVNRTMQEATSFTNLYKRFIPSLKDSSMSLKFNSDFDTGSVDDTLWTPWDNGTSIDVKLRPDGGGISPDNPEYVQNSFIENYSILNVTAGAIAPTDVSFKNASGTVLRNVA